MPWAGVVAGKIIEQIRRLIPTDYPLRFSFAYETTKLRQTLPKYVAKVDCEKKADSEDEKLDKLYQLKCRNVVYKYTCECNSLYIGETKRRLFVRANEHKSEKSPLSEHLNECKSAFKFENFSILAGNLKGKRARKKYESLFIKYYDKRLMTMNICSSSMALTIF